MKKTSLLFIVLLAFLYVGCKKDSAAKKELADSLAQQKAQDMQAVAGNFSNQTSLHFDSTILSRFLVQYPDFQEYTDDLHKFYRTRQYAYAWYDKKGLIEQASSLYNRVQQLTQEGIADTLPYTKEFQLLMDNAHINLQKSLANADAELMLTAQYLSFARHAWQGVSEKDALQNEWFIARKKLTTQELLDSLLSFSKNEPVYRQYGLLKPYLKRYRDIEAAGGWRAVSSVKKSLQKGDSSETIVQIKKRLRTTGEYSGDTTSGKFTEALEEAVKQFQQTRGLNPDGVVGMSAIRQMNIPVDKLIERILVNMERSRWVPVSLKGDYLVVNIPAYKLYVYQNDTLKWDMNVVAGQPIHKTVIFNGEMKHIVFSPYWNVPPDILKNEILPGMRHDSSYLQKHNMEMLDAHTVRQKPGPRNSLGLVKFLFANSYNIYLHDTPSKSLFSRDQRAFSHGCIRLGEPKKLATYLLRNDPGWTESKIDKAMNSGVEKYVVLKKPVPIFIAYFTAWVAQDGKLNFRDDVYERDDRLAGMLIK